MRQWYQLESASELSVHDAALYFKIELEDEISFLKRKGEECSPDELRRIQQGEIRLENLKKVHNWKKPRRLCEVRAADRKRAHAKDNETKRKKGKEHKGQR